MKKLVCLFIGVLVMSCLEGKSDKNEPSNTFEESKELKDSTVNNVRIKQSVINGGIGVVSVTDNISKKDTIKVYNKNGALWYKFTFFYDDSDGIFEYSNDDFKPLAFHVDNFLLAFKVTDIFNDRYEVIVNEETNLKKFLKKEDFLLFQTWEEHILSVSSVAFNEHENPLLRTPVENSRRIPYNKEEFYQPTKLKGDWLQVKWGSEGNFDYGWIKWKDGEKLLIELYYLA